MPDRKSLLPRRLRAFAAALLTIALVSFCALAWSRSTSALPVLEIVVTVNTTGDNNTSSLFCSLRQAINATNQNIKDHGCDAANGSSTLPDHIVFVQQGQFNILTPLPPIENGPLDIDGGARGVELHGAGATSNFDGLTVAVSAPGTSIRNLVINNFDGAGILIQADNVLVTGNFIGTNSAGDTAAGNSNAGIYVKAPDAHIGGTTGTTPGGPCTGDCNVISGNEGFGGIFMESGGSGAIVEGNFVGTDVTGNVSIPNFRGVSPTDLARVGGTSAAARNVISGNTHQGIRLKANALIEGNYIGTNAAGDTALPNDQGISAQNTTSAQIGGAAAGAGNVISGNSSAGIEIDEANGLQIFGNLIGLAADGTSPLPNQEGVRIYGGSTNDAVGGTGNGEGNEIAFNRDPGVVVSGDGTPTSGDPIRGNSIHDNDPMGISNEVGGNLELAPPVINSVGVAVAGHGVSGTACSSCEVDVYSDDAGQGRIYEGTVTASGAGDWAFDAAVTGPQVTTTANDSLGNTSEFSEPFTAPAPTPTPSPTPSPSPSPSPTPTTSTPTPTSGPALIQGDVDCSGEVDVADFVFLIEYAAGLNDGTTATDCPDLGGALSAGGSPEVWGDVNCDDVVDARDALAVLAYPDFELPHPGCEDIGHFLS